MSLRRIPVEEVRQRYSEDIDVWPSSDSWHRHLHDGFKETLRREKQILNLDANAKILNVGSRGESYGFTAANHFHLDLQTTSPNKAILEIVGDAHDLPFAAETFDLVLMIGSVVNYCDAMRVIGECSRCLKRKGHFIFDFENLQTWEHHKHWGNSIALVCTDYRGEEEKLWLYSQSLIGEILNVNNFTVARRQNFHSLTGLLLEIWDTEALRKFYSRFDKYFSAVPLIRNRSASIMLTCQKSL